jgi:hypothetical protein
MWRRTSRRVRIALVVLAGAVSTCASTALASSAASRDRAATRAFLSALYAYERSLVADAPASTAAVEALASKIGGECPGVLAGAPAPEPPFSSAPQAPEARKKSRQLRRLQSEISFALSRAYSEAGQPAALAMAAAIRELRWSDGRITRAVAAFAGELASRLSIPPPAVCADLKAWVASGYKTLPAGTQELRARQRARLGEGLAAYSVFELLQRFEGLNEQALLREIQRGARGRRGSLATFAAAQERLERTLGLTVSPEEQFQSGPAKGSVLLASAKTASGEKFKAWLEPKASRGNEGCALPLSIESSDSGGGSTSGACLSRTGRSPEPSVNCNSGLLRITADPLPTARSGRLALSDGRQITSRLIVVPARLGGPATYYYQVVRGPSPIPVALTELDGHGRALHVLQLPHIVECTEHPVKILPGGLRTIVRDHVPTGPEFRIIGERFRFLGKVEFNLKVSVAPTAGQGGGGSAGGTIGAGSLPFFLQTQSGCRPHPYTIMYGILTRPRDVVLAKAGGKLYVLRHVTPPASLHAGGVLAYAAVSAQPSELIIRAPGGKTVLSERLGIPGKPDFCKLELEEEAEG